MLNELPTEAKSLVMDVPKISKNTMPPPNTFSSSNGPSFDTMPSFESNSQKFASTGGFASGSFGGVPSFGGSGGFGSTGNFGSPPADKGFTDDFEGLSLDHSQPEAVEVKKEVLEDHKWTMDEAAYNNWLVKK